MSDVSDVPLTEDVVKQEPLKVSPTFMEWVADGNAEQVLIEKQTSASNTEIYVVPDNFTLFITAAHVTGFSTGVNEHGISQISIAFPDGSSFPFVSASLDHEAGSGGGTSAAAISFPMPIKLNAGGKIILFKRSGYTGTIAGAFVGFLLPLKISIR